MEFDRASDDFVDRDSPKQIRSGVASPRAGKTGGNSKRKRNQDARIVVSAVDEGIERSGIETKPHRSKGERGKQKHKFK